MINIRVNPKTGEEVAVSSAFVYNKACQAFALRSNWAVNDWPVVGSVDCVWDWAFPGWREKEGVRA